MYVYEIFWYVGVIGVYVCYRTLSDIIITEFYRNTIQRYSFMLTLELFIFVPLTSEKKYKEEMKAVEIAFIEM